MTQAELLRKVVDAHRRDDRLTAERLGDQWMGLYTGTGSDRFATGGSCQVRERTRTTNLSRPHTPVRVLLEPKALDDIKRMAYWDTGMDSLETGGGLFGINTGEEVLVTHTNGPGRQAKRARGAVEFSTDALRHFDRDESVIQIGCWHTHPGGSGSPSDYGASSGDITSWRAGLSRMRGDRWNPTYLGLIVTGEHGWAQPTIHGWILDRNDNLESATVSAL